ncbi:MAG: peptide ABC transporter substrate-binding protein [Elusimicrobia bacterium CG_4_9_14_3_um_filter_62_55]|nr:MAG: peptide ABC transporter substrate-binding protein [Elusimicrobia bacterium CG22_combo_CG10-13_8_21_14_all_63_91]PJA13160.1 MAG: peptide ABC transporter substrate-binding protein [Elusimicrobia bacterium CG_4_10_14_0_2_um_filter_63_34]PJB26085.1 MAG: peptide ABC transporter substrate-binding protein [Elusimicrobia bacterium CG_4_9_14_3_um_filter_62_55]
MKRLFPWAFTVLLAAAGCSGKPAPATFTYAATGEITSLDPVTPYDAVSQGVIFNVYETLIGFERDRNDRFVPLLATKVPSRENGLISQDGRTYRFPIRKGVRFHDGSVMRPGDVRYSLMRFMLTDRAGGPSSLLLEPILGIASTRDKDGNISVDFAAVEKAVRVDGDDVVITLKEPFAPFLSIMARWSYVMSRAWATERGAWNGSGESWKKFNNPGRDQTVFSEAMNGTGAFLLERWDRPGRKLLLGRHEAYWREPAKLNRVMILSIPEFGTRKLLLQGGDADIIEVPRTYLSQVTGMPSVRIEDGLPRLLTDPSFFFTFDINQQANPDIGSGKLDGEGIPSNFFADKDLRKAFAYSFDYDAFINETFKGRAARARGPIPPGLPGYDPDGPMTTFDKKKAEAYFRKAWGGQVWKKGFRFTMTYNTGGDVREYACQILKKGVESINPKFKIDMRGLEWAAYLDRAQKRMMPLFSRGWTADYPDAHNFVFPYYHSKGRYPIAQGFKNETLDARIDEAVRTVDAQKRAGLYHEILKLGFEETPQLYTVHPPGVYAMRDRVRGFYDNAVFMGVYFYPLSRAE